jgi:hypothetical protein
MLLTQMTKTAGHKGDTLPFSENKSSEALPAGDSFRAVAGNMQVVLVAGNTTMKL